MNTKQLMRLRLTTDRVSRENVRILGTTATDAARAEHNPRNVDILPTTVTKIMEFVSLRNTRLHVHEVRASTDGQGQHSVTPELLSGNHVALVAQHDQ